MKPWKFLSLLMYYDGVHRVSPIAYRLSPSPIALRCIHRPLPGKPQLYCDVPHRLTAAAFAAEKPPPGDNPPSDSLGSENISGGLPSASNAEGPLVTQLIVKLKSAKAAAPSDVPIVPGRSLPLTFVREMSGDAFVVALPEALPAEQAQAVADLLMALPEVEYAELDRILSIKGTPNDTQYNKQWNYFNPASGSYGINAPAAWDITTGASNIVVAVIDTGITSHFDLQGRTLPGYDFVSDAWMANDGGGRDSDPSDSGDWVNGNECFYGSRPANSSWHGTHVAGTIGASTNNAAGVAGINWTSQILPVRVLGHCGGLISDIVDGMRWAAGLPVPGVPANPTKAQVLNLSLGGPGACSQTEKDAISAITAAGSTVVVAAGNENSDAGSYSPASCPGVITVAATERSGSRSYYSNYGASIELSGPGGDVITAGTSGGVLSTLNTGPQDAVGDTYAYYQGTSMAAPHVAGVASLLYSLVPGLTPAQVLQIMQNTVTAFPIESTCTTSSCGSGIVNAGNAVSVLPRLTSLSPGKADVGDSLTLIVNGANFNSSFKIYWNGGLRTTSYVSSTQLTTQLTPGDLVSSGTYKVTVSGISPVYGTLTSSSKNFSVGLNRSNYLPFVNWNLLPPSILVNGDFEAGADVPIGDVTIAASWIVFSTHGRNIIQTGGVTPKSGSFLAWLGGEDYETNYIQQIVSVNPTLPYLTYYHWIDSTDWCGYDYATIRVDGFLVGFDDLCQSTNTQGWVKRSVNLSAYAGKTILLRIGVDTDESYPSSLFVDDVIFSSTIY